MAPRTIGLLGEDRGHVSHRELSALVPQLLEQFQVRAVWVPTDSAFDVCAFDGIWLVPGSPYADDNAVIDALRRIRTEGIPFLGTCGGLQYAVMEFLRTERGQAATHAESDGVSSQNAIEPLACSLDGVESRVTPVAGSRFSNWVSEPFMGMHFCSFGPSEQSVATLRSAGVVVGATSKESGAEVLEFPDHPFYIASLFQPHIGASGGAPVHPLVRAYLGALQEHPS